MRWPLRTRQGRPGDGRRGLRNHGRIHMTEPAGSGCGRQGGWVSRGHPQVAGSVLNDAWRATARHPRVPPVSAADSDRHFEERDCGPHALDVMAISALYQTG